MFHYQLLLRTSKGLSFIHNSTNNTCAQDNNVVLFLVEVMTMIKRTAIFLLILAIGILALKASIAYGIGLLAAILSYIVPLYCIFGFLFFIMYEAAQLSHKYELVERKQRREKWHTTP